MKTTSRILTWRNIAVLSISIFLYVVVICAGLTRPTRLHAAPTPQGAPCTNSPNVGFFVPNVGNVSNWGLCINADLNSLDNLLGGSATLANNATPSATGFTNWLTANSGPVTITNFTGGFAGQTIRILCSSGDTTTNINSTANISVLSNWNCAASSTLSLTLIGSVWREVGRGTGNVTGVALLGSPNTFTQANTFNTTLHAIGLAEFDAGISVDGIHPELIPVNTSTLVDLSAVQTLINKALTSPAITGGTLSSSTLTTPTINGATFTSSLVFTSASGSLGPLTPGAGILNTANTWGAAQNLSSGGTLTGTFAGTHTESGATTFSAAVTFSGSGTTGVLTAGNGLLATANAWSAVQTLASPVINNGSLNGTVTNNANLTGGAYSTATLYSPAINNGVYPSGTGFQHLRATGCALMSGMDNCNYVQNWNNTWADTNYTVECTASDAVQVSFTSKSTTQFTVIEVNLSGTMITPEIDCTGVHD